MPYPDMQSNWKEQHPDEGQLHEWLEEQLAPGDAARVAAHVSACEECRARVAEAHGLIAASRRILSALDDVPSGVIPHAAALLSSSPSASSPSLSHTGPSLAPADVTADARAAASFAAPARIAPQAGEQASGSFRWRRWGSIAAVLVLAVTGLTIATRNSSTVLSAPTAPTGPAVSTAPRSADTVQTQATAQANAQATVPANASAPVPAPGAGATANAGAQPSAKVRAAAPMATGATSAVSAASEAAPRLAKREALSALSDSVAAKRSAGVVAQTPPAAGGQDTLSARLEAERRKRMASEAIAADAKARPRIDALPITVSAPPPLVEKSIVPFAATAGNAGAAAAFDTLVLMREPCFGRCPAYELRVDGGGRVRYQSRITDDTTREKNVQLAATDLARLRDLLSRASVETMKSYEPGTPGCGMQATDMPTLRLRVFMRGRWFSLEQYMGCSAGTQLLPTLMRQIDAIVGTQRWLPAGYRIN